MKNHILYKGLAATLFITCANNALAAPLDINAADQTKSVTEAVDSISFTTDHALIVDGAGVVVSTTGNVTAAAGNQGSISLVNGGSLDVDGTIGDTNAIKQLTTDTSDGITVDKGGLAASINTLDINTSGAGSSFISTGGSITTTAGFTVAGTMSLTDTAVTSAAPVAVDGTSNITLAGGSALTDAQGLAVSGSVTGSTLTLSDAADAKQLSLGADSDLTINASGTANTGAIALGNGSTVTIAADDQTVSVGAITTGATGEGTAAFTKAFDLDAAVGTVGNKLAQVNIKGDNTVALTAGANEIHATAVNFEGDTKLVVAGGAVDAALTTTANGEGTVEYTAAHVLGGQIGTTTNALKAVNIKGDNTVALTAGANEINATAVNFEGDSKIILAAGDLNANVTTSADGEGNIDVTANRTLAGNIGTSLAKINTVNLTADLTTGANNVYATAVNFAGDHNLTIANNAVNADITAAGDGINGTVAFTGTAGVNGALGATGNALKAVNYTTGANTALATTIFAANTTIDADAVVGTTADSTINGNLAMSGTSSLNLGLNKVDVTGTANVDTGTTISSNINSSSDFGSLVTVGEATVHADAKVNLNVNGIIENNDSFMIIDGAESGDHVAEVALAATENSNLFDFAQDTADKNNLVYKASLASTFDTDTQNTKLASLGSAIQTDLANGDVTSTELFNTLDNIAGLTTAQQAAAMNILLAEQNGAQVETTFANQDKIFETISRRLETNTPEGLWLATSFSSLDKDTIGNIDGYDADATSITIGADTKRPGNVDLGFALTYTNTDIDGKDSFAGNKNDVDSYNATVYGSKTLVSGIEIKGQATIGQANFDSTRNLTSIGAGVVKGDYDALTYGINADVSKDYMLPDVTVTPIAGLAFNKASFDSYTETGSDAALAVEKESFNSLKSKLGAKVALHEANVNPEWTIKPEVRGYWRHEFINNDYDYKAKLVGAKSTFVTNGVSPESDILSLGAGVELANRADWKVALTYDANLSSDSKDQIGQIRISKKF